MKLYHYTVSGLDNIYLLNGFNIIDTPYGEGVSFDNVDELHKVISKTLLSSPLRLNSKEYRFLRKEMRLSQNTLAQTMGTDEQTIARIEKGETEAKIPFEATFRALSGEILFNKKSQMKLLLSEITNLENKLINKEIYLEKKDSWIYKKVA